MFFRIFCVLICVIAYVNAVIVYKRAVHVDDDLVAHKDVLPVFAMEVDVHVAFCFNKTIQ